MRSKRSGSKGSPEIGLATPTFAAASWTLLDAGETPCLGEAGRTAGTGAARPASGPSLREVSALVRWRSSEVSSGGYSLESCRTRTGSTGIFAAGSLWLATAAGATGGRSIAGGGGGEDMCGAAGTFCALGASATGGAVGAMATGTGVMIGGGGGIGANSGRSTATAAGGNAGIAMGGRAGASGAGAGTGAASSRVDGSQRWLQRRQLIQPDGRGGPAFGSRQRGQNREVMAGPISSLTCWSLN